MKLLSIVNEDDPNCSPNPKFRKTKHLKCLGSYDYWGEFDCGYNTTILCEDCKYGLGSKNPESKCNQM
jgi:hypothetical protein